MLDLIEATAEFTGAFHDSVLQKAMESWKTVHGQAIERPALPSKIIERKMFEEVVKRKSKAAYEKKKPAMKKHMNLDEEQGREDSKINELLSVPVASSYSNIAITTPSEALGTTRISAESKGKQRADSVVPPIFALSTSPLTPEESTPNPSWHKRKLPHDDSDNEADTLSFMFMKK